MLVSADSQPPVPVPVKIKGVPAFVWNTYLLCTGSGSGRRLAARSQKHPSTVSVSAVIRKHSLGVVQQLLEEGCKEGVPVVLARHVHGTQHALVDVDGPCVGGGGSPNCCVSAKRVVPAAMRLAGCVLGSCFGLEGAWVMLSQSGLAAWMPWLAWTMLLLLHTPTRGTAQPERTWDEQVVATWRIIGVGWLHVCLGVILREWAEDWRGSDVMWMGGWVGWVRGDTHRPHCLRNATLTLLLQCCCQPAVGLATIANESREEHLFRSSVRAGAGKGARAG